MLFGSRYARKPIKGSKYLDDSLDPNKTLSQKIGLLNWRPSPVKLEKIRENMTLLRR